MESENMRMPELKSPFRWGIQNIAIGNILLILGNC